MPLVLGLSAKVPATFVPFGCATALLSTFCVISSSIFTLLELDVTRADRPLKEISKQIADLVTWLGPVAAPVARAGFGHGTAIYFFCN